MEFVRGKQIAAVLGLVAAAFAVGCSSDDTTDNGSTGTTGETGTSGGSDGGSTTSTSGYTSTSGGTASTTGGSDGGSSTSTTSGNTTTTGGSDGGSSTGDGGTGGSGLLFDFKTGVQGFALNTHSSATILPGDGGIDAGAIVSFDSMVGHPDPGSLKVDAPFTGAGQQVDIQGKLSGVQDWTCKKLHVFVKIDSGTGLNGVQPYVFSASSSDDGSVEAYGAFAGGFNSIQAAPDAGDGGWVDYVFDPAKPTFANTGYDPTKIDIIGIQIQTHPVPAADAGEQPVPATEAVVHIDSFSLETVAGCGGDGGTTGGDAGTTTATGGSDGGSTAASDDGGTTGATGDASTTTGGSDGGATAATNDGGTTGATGDAGTTTGGSDGGATAATDDGGTTGATGDAGTTTGGSDGGATGG